MHPHELKHVYPDAAYEPLPRDDDEREDASLRFRATLRVMRRRAIVDPDQPRVERPRYDWLTAEQHAAAGSPPVLKVAHRAGDGVEICKCQVGTTMEPNYLPSLLEEVDVEITVRDGFTGLAAELDARSQGAAVLREMCAKHEKTEADALAATEE